jgi:membrane protein DedA with SNARE-associated domain
MEFLILIQTYGYPIIFLGTLLEGETVVGLAGLVAHRGYLQLPLVVLAAAVGGFLSDELLFFLGRRCGPLILKRHPYLQPAVGRVTRLLRRHASTTIVLVRFAYGLRTAGPVAIGISQVSWGRFVVLNLLGAVAWGTVWAVLGYQLDGTLEVVLGDLKEFEGWLFGGLLVAGITVGIVIRARQQAQAAVLRW